MRLYHRTTAHAAVLIVRDGFRDCHFDAEEDMERGVWFSQDPDEWALASPALLAIDVPDEQLRPEWQSKQYPIEWQIPSSRLSELRIAVMRLL